MRKLGFCGIDGNPAISMRPVAFRPCLATGLAWSFYQHAQLETRLRDKAFLTKAPQAVVEPGVYILQAGSFSTHEDADRRRAELGLQGITSHIQRVKINERNYHRVLIGPIDDLDELNVVRSLASAGGHGCPEDVRERTPQLLSFRNFPKTGSDGLVPPLLSPGGHAHFEPARGRQKNRPVPATPLPLARVPGSSEARAISLYQARIVSER